MCIRHRDLIDLTPWLCIRQVSEVILNLAFWSLFMSRLPNALSTVLFKLKPEKRAETNMFSQKLLEGLNKLNLGRSFQSLNLSLRLHDWSDIVIRAGTGRVIGPSVSTAKTNGYDVGE
jgi:hypothetical protein